MADNFHNNKITSYLSFISKKLDFLSNKYEKVQQCDNPIDNFCDINNLWSLMKAPTWYKIQVNSRALT